MSFTVEPGTVQNPKTITLCMIVRNEAHVLPRSLASFRRLASLGFNLRYCISDGGSTDGTMKLIHDHMAGIEGQVFLDEQPHPIDDFSKYRNRCIERAPKDGYLFFLDADDELEITLDPDFPLGAGELEADAYEVNLINAGVTWQRTVLVRADFPWKYVGPSHELLTLDGQHFAPDFLPAFRIVVHGGEGARSLSGKKAENDASLLAKAAENDPTNPRHQFYLAQSLRDSGHDRGALEAYKKRAEMSGGWDEETYITLLEYARLLIKIGEASTQEVQEACLSAYNFRPQRSEAMGVLAVYMRAKEQWQSAMAFSMIAASNPIPEDRLLVERDWYLWRAWEVFSICSFYAGHPEKSQMTCIDLLMNPELPKDHVEQTKNNLHCANTGRWKKI